MRPASESVRPGRDGPGAATHAAESEPSRLPSHFSESLFRVTFLSLYFPSLFPSHLSESLFRVIFQSLCRVTLPSAPSPSPPQASADVTWDHGHARPGPDAGSECECGPMSAILARANVTHVDLYSIGTPWVGGIGVLLHGYVTRVDLYCAVTARPCASLDD